MSTGQTWPHAEALPLAQALAALLAPACEQIKIAGSIRRGKPIVGDGELVAIPRIFPEGNALWWLLDALVADGTLKKFVGTDKNGKPFTRWGSDYRAVVYRGLKVDIFTADAANFGYQYLLRTGPGEANTRLMQLLFHAPFKFRDGYAWYGEDRLDLPDEPAVFDLLGMTYLPPDKRSRQAYERALPQNHRFPNPADRLARQQASRMVWDDCYDADAGYTWVRQVDYLVDIVAEKRYQRTRITYQRLPKTSAAAQHAALFLAGLQMPALRAAYASDFRTWCEQSLELPGHDMSLVPQLDGRYVHFSYAPDAVWVETVPTACIVPIIRFAEMIHVMREVYDIAEHGEGTVLPWHGMICHSRQPYALRFLGDDTLYLLAGQHRYLALLLHLKTDIQVRVDHIPLTLAEAMKGSAIKPPGLAYDRIPYDADDWHMADILEEVLQILADARELLPA